MKVPMGPPPPKIHTVADASSNSTSSSSSTSVEETETEMKSPPNENNRKVPMGPPPPTADASSNSSSSSSVEETQTKSPPNENNTKVPMGPPPPKIPISSNEPSTTQNNNNHQNTALPTEAESVALAEAEAEAEPFEQSNPNPATTTSGSSGVNINIPYTIPPWSSAPPHPYSLEVLKDGLIIDQFLVNNKGAYMFGRVDLCDFVLQHPTVSRFHAVLQFKQSGEAYVYDLGSTHGTFVNKNQVKKKVYTELHVGDVIRFGQSSRLYILQGPTELMPVESDLKKIRRAKTQEEIQDREASLSRARMEASRADGISWGMGDDAIEEAEEDTDEVTWQTYKGQLTERQEKTRDKIIKRTEKIANMKKEIDAIRVKDIAQGGLTQGQQTQIARNEQRISQILEELESLEETLNESIQESLGARAGKVRGKKKGVVEDEEDKLSDDDEFYDRTKKPAILKGGEHPSIETADSLLDKKEAIVKEMEAKRNLLLYEETRMLPGIEGGTEGGDALDAFMTGLSSQLKHDTASKIQKDLSTLQSELERILYLLKIADPAGEASKRRDSKVQASRSNQSDISTGIKDLPKEKKSVRLEKPTEASSCKEGPPEATKQVSKIPEADKNVTDAIESKIPIYTDSKPQWLGAIHDIDMKESPRPPEAASDTQESDQFVDYKDRKEALGSSKDVHMDLGSGIEGAAPGLIIRKRKQMDKPDNVPEQSTSSSAEAESTAADAVALLLKHKRGYLMSDVDEQSESPVRVVQSKKENTSTRKVLGPQRPAFHDDNPDYESWVPPEGQSGDGRTSLNDRYGY